MVNFGMAPKGGIFDDAGSLEIERESRIGVDLTFNGTRVMEITSCIMARYDAGICKHKLERTGVCEISMW